MKTRFFPLLAGLLLMFSLGACRTYQAPPPRKFHRVFSWGYPRDEETARKYAEIGVTDIQINTKKHFDLAVKYGITPYCKTFTPAGPYPQVMTEEENAYKDYIGGADLDEKLTKEQRNEIIRQRMIEKNYRYGGEPDGGALNVMANYDIPCFNSDKDYALSKQKLDKLLENTVPGVKGIYFDGIGYRNLHGCYCEKCLADYSAFLQKNKLADTQANKDAFYRDILVNYYNAMIDYVKGKHPEFKVMAHFWPVFQPDPLFANRTKVDYCGQTVAWYFQWPQDKIAKYTRHVLKYEKKYHSNAEGIPFVGLNVDKRKALACKSPEELEKELQTILASGGRTLMVCNGPDMILPGYYEVFKKYCGRPETPDSTKENAKK